MTRPKTERNELIFKLRGKGYTYRQIFEEFQKRGYRELKTVKSVGMQLSRLKAGEGVPASTRQPVSKVTAPR